MQKIKAFIRRWRQLRRRNKILSVAGFLVVLGALAFYMWIFAGLPPIDRLQAGLALPSTRILDRNGRLLYEIIAPQGGRHTAVPLSQIPKSIIDATAFAMPAAAKTEETPAKKQ